MRHLFGLGVIAVTLMALRPVTPCAAQMKTSVPEEAQAEAHRSLQGLKQMVTEETYRGLGFESPKEADRIQLEAPMRVFMVRLDRLREYKPQANAAELLVDTNEIRYPVSVDGQIRTSVVVRLIEGKWQIARFGRPALTKALTEATRKQRMMPKTSPESWFEVNIPALNLYFVGRKEESRLVLTTLVDDSRFELKQGETIDAQQLFGRLVPYAQQLKTGPYLAD